ncbi:MAG: ABC transporter permease [SAR202 cluster bacterium]|nr:ABC transporter permease [SAR202 cluster bacterium]
MNHDGRPPEGFAPAGRTSLWAARVRLALRSSRETWRAFAANPIGVVGVAIILIFGLMAVAHPLLMATLWDPTTYDPVTGFGFDEISHPAPPSWRHLLGTDPLGRDILSQLTASTTSAFVLGLVAALVTVGIATMVGALAAYYGGVVDAFFMRLADLIIILPTISLLIVLTALLGLNLFQLALVLGVLGGFGGTAVVIKSQALSIKVKPYIEAAQLAGGGPWHIILVHIVPNLLPLSLLYMMFTVTGAIFSEAVLSFFGILHIRMSWGIMIHTASTGGYLLGGASYWWLIVPAGAAITLLCSSFYLVGRALDEVVNPRLRGR